VSAPFSTSRAFTLGIRHIPREISLAFAFAKKYDGKTSRLVLHQEEHVPNELKQEVLRNLVKLGAQARLEQIEMERRAILATFPDLGGVRRRPGRPPRGGQAAEAPAAAKPRRRRRTMTAAQRKEVSERMRKYWAERRKAKAKGK
jgi:hypothetical protein